MLPGSKPPTPPRAAQAYNVVCNAACQANSQMSGITASDTVVSPYASASVYIGPGYGNGIITTTDTGGFSWLLAVRARAAMPAPAAYCARTCIATAPI